MRQRKLNLRRERILSGVTRLKILGTAFFVDCPPKGMLDVYGLYSRWLIVWEEVQEEQPVMRCKIRKLRELRKMDFIRTPENPCASIQSNQIEMFGGPR